MLFPGSISAVYSSLAEMDLTSNNESVYNVVRLYTIDFRVLLPLFPHHFCIILLHFSRRESSSLLCFMIACARCLAHKDLQVNASPLCALAPRLQNPNFVLVSSDIPTHICADYLFSLFSLLTLAVRFGRSTTLAIRTHHGL